MRLRETPRLQRTIARVSLGIAVPVRTDGLSPWGAMGALAESRGRRRAAKLHDRNDGAQRALRCNP